MTDEEIDVAIHALTDEQLDIVKLLIVAFRGAGVEPPAPSE